MDVRKVERPSEAFGRAASFLSFFLTCCVRVNSCSLTPMTAVHFLHQTDIGLALRKHEAIYGITPTLFSPSLCLSLPPVFAFALCKHERVTRAGQNSSPSPPQASVPRPPICVSPSAVALAPRRGPVPLSPRLRSPPFAGLFCRRFDRRD